MTGRRSRAEVLFGTGEDVAPLRRLSAGALTAELDRGSLRHVRWGGLEVIRAIAFIVRDTRWGTYSPDIEELAVNQTSERFTVAYTARCHGPEGDLAFRAEIEGSADGTVAFRARGGSDTGFATNRAGFVVLHPLDGVVGRPVAVEHASGGRSHAVFPEFVSPTQPVFDIRALAHEPRPGLRVSVRMEGDAFEMEDHRNWTDASFKTYVRPLARGFPYRIAPGERLEQSVALRIDGRPPPGEAAASETAVTVRGVAGLVPQMGLFLDPRDLEAAEAVAARTAALAPAFLLGRLDLRGGTAGQFARLAGLAGSLGCPLALQAVVAGAAPDSELRPLVEALGGSAARIDSLHVVPARDLKGRAPDSTPPGEATAAEILAAARRAFPGRRLAGGMPLPFPELNRNRPPADIDVLTHATQATVHAADDVSVMETLQSLRQVIRSARAFAGGVPYRIGPATIGCPAFSSASEPADNPTGRRVPMASRDPRQGGLFAAAFALGFAAIAAAEGIEALTLAAAAGPFAAFGDDGGARPIAAVIAAIAANRDRTRLGVTGGGEKIAALAFEGADGRELVLANLGGGPTRVTVAGARFSSLRLIDAAALADVPADLIDYGPLACDAVELDAYAVAFLK